LVANKNVGFRCHKNILRKISSVFEDLISGDAETEKLTLNDISNENIKLLQKVVYENPKDRNKTFCENMKFKNILNSILLASKYNVLFMRNLLENFVETTTCHEISFAGQLWEELKYQNITVAADIVFKKHAQSADYIQSYSPQSLKGVPIKMVKEMTRNCKCPSRSSTVRKENAKNWMQKFIEYAICSEEDEEEISVLKTLIRERLCDRQFLDQDQVADLMHQLLKDKPWCQLL
jgi:hypothetical protein